MLPAEPAGPHRDAAGGRQPHPPRERRAGQRRGGPDLPAALEGAQRVRPAERPGAARRLPAAGESHSPAPRRAGPPRRDAGSGQAPTRRARALREEDGARGGPRRALIAAAPAGLLLRVRLLGHLLRQRRDLAVLPASRHPQQHGAQPGRDVRRPGRPPPRDFRMPALPA